MKSIYFLSLNALEFVPYAYGLLRSFAETDPRVAGSYAWHEPLTRIEAVETTAARIKAPDILCASCYVWNDNQQAAIIRRVKAAHPDCRVILGGPHVPDNSEGFFAARPEVDILVHGEGELPFYHLLLALRDDSPRLESIANISCNANGKTLKTRTAPGLTTASGQKTEPGQPAFLPIPSPFLNGIFDRFLADGEKNKIGLWETNRGCPYACSFCDWGVRSTNKIRRHDMKKIAAEIDYIAHRKIEDLYITDCNFGILERDLKITEELVAARRKYGYPKRVRIQFAKNSNDTVFEISRMLHAEDMLWGTTLSMQSVDDDVLAAVNRRQIGTRNYQLLKDRYRQVDIPTYTELILGLPAETRTSFIDGICTLMEIGIHDDIRVYELALLPNAPLNQPRKREAFGLKTKVRALRIPSSGCEKETVEIVFETNTLPQADWAYCYLFEEMIQALHNGAYTRFLSIYLNDTGQMSYRRFYNRLLTVMLHSSDPAHAAFRRVRDLIAAYCRDDSIPQIAKMLTQPDMSAFLASFNPRRKGWHLWTYLWLAVSETTDAFYAALRTFLEGEGIAIDAVLEDLLHYQQELMLTVEYDPGRGKEGVYRYNWFDCFFHNAPLKQEAVTLQYTDTHMGITNRYPLEKGNRLRFVNAAIGISYPYTKFRHFFHQPDRVEKK